MLCRLILILSINLFSAPLARAATLTVDSAADNLTADAFCTLREAVMASNNDADFMGCVASALPYGDDEIILMPAAGQILLTLGSADENLNQSGDLDIYDTVTIRNGNLGVIAVSGAGNDRVFHLQSSGVELTLDRIRVTSGNPPASGEIQGGGILAPFGLTGTVIRLVDSEVRGNAIVGNGVSAALGGGIYSAGDVILERSLVLNNDAINVMGGLATGGAISLTGAANLTATDSVITDNTALAMGTGTASGGGIGGNSSGLIILERSELSENMSESVSGNAFSGGIGVAGTDVTLLNSTVSGNRVIADSSGTFAQIGGISVISSGILTINNSTVAFNSAESANGLGLSGGISVSSGSTSHVIANSILSGNTDSNGVSNCNNGADITSLGYNIINGGCGIAPVTGDQTGVDPLLETLQDNGGVNVFTENPRNHLLAQASPAVDAGNPGMTGGLPNCLSGDQRGISRPQDGNGDAMPQCDIGAVELEGVTVMLTVMISGSASGTVTSTPAGINCPGDCGEEYALGSMPTLNATPSGGAIFLNWAGGCSGMACQPTLNQDTTVFALFGDSGTLFIDGYE